MGNEMAGASEKTMVEKILSGIDTVRGSVHVGILGSSLAGLPSPTQSSVATGSQNSSNTGASGDKITFTTSGLSQESALVFTGVIEAVYGIFVLCLMAYHACRSREHVLKPMKAAEILKAARDRAHSNRPEMSAIVRAANMAVNGPVAYAISVIQELISAVLATAEEAHATKKSLIEAAVQEIRDDIIPRVQTACGLVREPGDVPRATDIVRHLQMIITQTRAALLAASPAGYQLAAITNALAIACTEQQALLRINPPIYSATALIAKLTTLDSLVSAAVDANASLVDARIVVRLITDNAGLAHAHTLEQINAAVDALILETQGNATYSPRIKQAGIDIAKAIINTATAGSRPSGRATADSVIQTTVAATAAASSLVKIIDGQADTHAAALSAEQNALAIADAAQAALDNSLGLERCFTGKNVLQLLVGALSLAAGAVLLVGTRLEVAPITLAGVALTAASVSASRAVSVFGPDKPTVTLPPAGAAAPAP
jgi:hypothetical protein